MASRTITTRATGYGKAPPELATVEVIAKSEGQSPSVARERVHDLALTIRESVTVVSEDQIQTTDVRIEDTTEMFDPETDAAFQAKERLRIQCCPDATAELVVEVTDVGGSINYVEFGHRKATHRQLQNEALSAAMERAREKAEQIAAAEGLTVGGIQEVTNEDSHKGFQGIIDDAIASSAENDLQPTPVTVSGEVEVVYELIEE